MSDRPLVRDAKKKKEEKSRDNDGTTPAKRVKTTHTAPAPASAAAAAPAPAPAPLPTAVPPVLTKEEKLRLKRTCKLIAPKNKVSDFWQHFCHYPKDLERDEIVCCKACYDKFHSNATTTEAAWEVDMGKHKAVEKLEAHIKSCHKELWDRHLHEIIDDN